MEDVLHSQARPCLLCCSPLLPSPVDRVKQQNARARHRCCVVPELGKAFKDEALLEMGGRGGD